MAESKRGDKMAERTSEERKYNPVGESKSSKGADTKGQTTEENKAALDRVVERQRHDLVGSPSQEDADLAVEALYSEEKEINGVTRVVTSISEEAALKAVSLVLPGQVNLRQGLDGVPGVTNLTGNGTLNSDGSVRAFPGDKLNDEWEAMAKVAGPNPLPNRIGNELTKAEQGFRADNYVRHGMSNLAVAEVIKKIREGGKVTDEDKRELEFVETAFRG